MITTAFGRSRHGVAPRIWFPALGVLGMAPAMALAGPAVHDPAQADQYQASRLADAIPANPEARRLWARHLAFQATVYGTAAVLEYAQLHAQAIDRSHPGFVGFNRFAHGRDLAGPDYQPFRTPNADTLYSNAWLDLRGGPVVLDVPDTGGRYYTAAFLDIHGNASNISARTHGTRGGRYLIATAEWSGPVPPGTTLFRVPTPLAWILLRVLVDRPSDLPIARALQDRFMLTGPAPAGTTPEAWPDGGDDSAVGFFRTLDFILRTCGNARGEEALVHGWDGIGLGGSRAFDEAIADPEIRAGLEQGHAEARQVIAGSMGRNGRRNGSWTDPVDLGRYGYNYLYRAGINTLGTGANVVDENHPFTSFHDETGAALDGARAAYELHLAPPPPARFFWSVTVYEQRTRALYPNAANRYVLGDRTPGLIRQADGSVVVRLQHAAVKGRTSANWLPVPAGPFYVVIRAQGPGPEIASGAWRPQAIHVLPVRPLP